MIPLLNPLFTPSLNLFLNPLLNHVLNPSSNLSLIPDIFDHPRLGSGIILGSIQIDNCGKKHKNLLKLTMLILPNILDCLKLSSGKAPCIENAHLNKKPRRGYIAAWGSAMFCRLTPVCILFLSFF